MKYRINDLTLKNDSSEEQERTRNIFEDLKTKIDNNIEINEHEKDFYCRCVELSEFDNEKVSDFNSCKNYYFKSLYLVYFYDLTGNSIYSKFKGASLYNPSKFEIQRDLKYLKSIASEWKNCIEITNHKNELKKSIAKETRIELKEYKKSVGKLIFRRDKNNYEIKILSILLQSKYLYCIALLIFEKHKKEDFVLELNQKTIEINEHSIIHILNRHFSQITKTHLNKTFHDKNIIPEYLNIQLKQIFNQIDNSELYKELSIDRIAFKYMDNDYTVWIKEKTKQVKGKGNMVYNSLETFYPIVEQRDVEYINSCTLKKINDELGVYIPIK